MKHSILVDLYKIKNLYSGLGQFSFNFAEALLNSAPEHLELHFLLSDKTVLNSENGYKRVSATLLNRFFPSLNRNYDLWHSLHQLPSHFPNTNTKQILTIHDLNFLIEKDKSKRSYYLNKLQFNVDKAKAITAISKYTKSLIEEHIRLEGKSIEVIYNGVKVDTSGVYTKPSFVKSDSFFFTIGIFNNKKNFHVLLPLMNHFTNDQLILAGDHETKYGEEIKILIKKLNLSDRILLPGKVSEAEKCWLYNNCKAFLFPSIAEGFGLPVIEAMNFGKPVFLSRESSLQETGGNLAYYFDDFETAGMIQTISTNLSEFYSDQYNLNNKIRQYASTYNWNQCIKSYIDFYTHLLE